MKRLLVWITLFLLLLPAGCAREEPMEEEAWPLRITAVLPHDDDYYWRGVAEGISQRAGALGIDAEIVWPQLNYNIPQMTEFIKEATAARVDAIITQGAEDPQYLTALAEAGQAGIQVVLIDTDITENNDYLYIGTDNLSAGRLLGEALVRVTGGQSVTAVISGAEHLSNMDQRLQGLREVIAQHPGIELRRVEYGNYDSITILEKYHLILQEDPDVDTFVCLEGTGCIALSRVLTPENCPLDHVLGFDLTEDAISGIRAGFLDGVATQQQRLMGRIAVEEIQRFAQEGSYSGAIRYTDTQFVTAENLEDAISEVEGYEQ